MGGVEPGRTVLGPICRKLRNAVSISLSSNLYKAGHNKDSAELWNRAKFRNYFAGALLPWYFHSIFFNNYRRY